MRDPISERRINKNLHRSHPLTSGRRLAKNTLWNLVGGIAPLVVAVATIPFIIRGLGIDRFGVQTLVWVIIGYFSLFDLGLGRSLTKVVADKLAEEDFASLPALFWTTLAATLALGVFGGAVLALSANWLAESFLKIPSALERETLLTLKLLAAGIPVVILTSALRGVLEAQQKFFGISVLRLLLGLYIYLAPLAVLAFTNDLVTITAVLLAGRVVFTLAHLVLCARSMPSLFSRFEFSAPVLRPLLSMGGWMTVSNVLGPILVNLDRFFIGAMVTIAAVAYYATPYEMITKVLLIPTAVAGVLFPAFSAGFRPQLTRTRGLFIRGGKYILFAVFPLLLVLIAYAPEGLRFWIGREFSANSYAVLQWLAVGIFFNSLAQIPFAFLQAIGRADLTAKVHVSEIPFYLALFFSLTEAFGIVGTAIAWSARASVDAFIMFALSARALHFSRNELFLMVSTLSLALAVMIFFTLQLGPLTKALLLSGALGGFGLAAWTRLVDAEEKNWLRTRLRLG